MKQMKPAVVETESSNLREFFPRKKKFMRRTPHGHTTLAFLWAPLFYAFLNILLSVLLSLINPLGDSEELRNQGLQASNFVATTAITILTLTFSLTFLSIQIAAQTYSPRLLDDFIKEPVSKVAIAVNVGAFCYSYTMSFYLNDPEHVPPVSIHFLSVQAIAVVVMFVVFMHFFVNGFRLEQILSHAVLSSWNAAAALELLNVNGPKRLRSSKRNKERSADVEDSLMQVPASAYKVLADSSGYVVRFELDQILEACEKMDFCVLYHPHIGEFVAEGTVVAYVWDAACNEETTAAVRSSIQDRVLGKTSSSLDSSENEVEELLGTLVADGIEMSPIRSGQLDVTLGIQQLCDVAVRALSAAINDPHTAIQAIDSLSALFGRLAHLEFTPAVLYGRGSECTVRLSSPRRSFTYLLSIMDPIRFYGSSDLQVTYRLIRFYGDLGAALKRWNKMDRIAGVLAQLEQCLIFAKRNFEDDSLEMKSIRELYEHSLEVMAVSNRIVLKAQESVEDDLQDLETTYMRATSHFSDTIPEKLKADVPH